MQNFLWKMLAPYGKYTYLCSVKSLTKISKIIETLKL